MATVLIKHKSKSTPRGGVGLTTAKPIVKQIKAFYMDGDVMDISGESWRVKPCSDSRADYETVGSVEV